MIEMPYSKPGTIRMWFNESERCRFTPERIETFSIVATPSALLHPRRVTVELVLRAPELFPYGLLGAVFLPAASGVLQVEVYCRDNDGVELFDSLARTPYKVSTGLPGQWAQAVIDGVVNAGTGSRLGSGLLRFDCAAYSGYSSLDSAFERLSRLVTRLLLLETRETRETTGGHSEPEAEDLSSVLAQME